jgi:hypothetical protein
MTMAYGHYNGRKSCHNHKPLAMVKKEKPKKEKKSFLM